MAKQCKHSEIRWAIIIGESSDDPPEFATCWSTTGDDPVGIYSIAVFEDEKNAERWKRCHKVDGRVAQVKVIEQ